MPIINIDTEFNATQLNQAGSLVLQVMRRIAEVWPNLSRAKRRLILQRSPKLRVFLIEMRDILRDMGADNE